MPREDFVRTTDDRGRLFIEHDFGAINAGREALVTLDLTPLAHFQGSRLHVLNFVDGPRLGERIDILLGNPAVETAADPEAVPIDHENPGETTIENYLATHPEDGWAAAIQQLGEGRWWAPHGGAKPQMDLVCKVRMAGKAGLLFVEAKAHEGELDWGGKPLADDVSEGSRQNHANITAQIDKASADLNAHATPGFNLSINNHYQLANRITYLWKLASLGIPVVLLYLGFTSDDYFPNDSLRDDRHWQRVMGGYLQGVVPHRFPERRFTMPGGGSLEMLIRSMPCR